jgi:hypothetical protein
LPAHTAPAVLKAIEKIGAAAKQKIGAWWKKSEAFAKVETGDDGKLEASAGVSHTWFDKNGAAAKFGDDKNNISLFSYEASATSGFTASDGGGSLNLIDASVEGSAISAQGQKDFLGGAAEVDGSVELDHVEAEAKVGADWDDKAKVVQAKVGASVDLVKADVGGSFKIPLPFGHTLTLGGGAEGEIGASAEANAQAGWTEEDGYTLGASAKVGLGLGGGLNFKIGFK